MAKATLTTLTPVHVGSGQKMLRNFDFVVDRNKVGFIDLERLVEIIGIDKIGQLTAVIENRSSVIDFLRKERGQRDLTLEDYCYRISTFEALNSNSNELKEHYHTSMKGVCIPGSSLKGAIRTGIWASLASESTQKSWRQQDYKLVKDGRLIKFFSDPIDKLLFGPNANEKTTRFLKVRDVHFPGMTTSIFEIGIYNAEYNKWNFKSGQSFLSECIPAGSASQCEIILDHNWLQKNVQSYPEKWSKLYTDFITKGYIAFCALLNKYMSIQLENEIHELEDEDFGNDLPGEEMLLRLKEIKTSIDKSLEEKVPVAIVRVGGNNGWAFTTGGWVRYSSHDVLNDTDFGSMRKSIQRGKVYDMPLWPKTRKMTKEGLPLGFIKVQFQDS